ncbi:hypothetical protein AK812_SmicGene5524 [Symbiodinium microadriaticum]|uniref:Uncharacterized protein n=1 Tax=Symbiodinium microadriaticum TaxID=2951 RepID=A0A1Q9ETG7_SYMMI|nr:hypothetical protein AK812_SmicGene5524 [Symbiodinium microadriaticum]
MQPGWTAVAKQLDGSIGLGREAVEFAEDAVAALRTLPGLTGLQASVADLLVQAYIHKGDTRSGLRVAKEGQDAFRAKHCRQKFCCKKTRHDSVETQMRASVVRKTQMPSPRSEAEESKADHVPLNVLPLQVMDEHLQPGQVLCDRDRFWWSVPWSHFANVKCRWE